MSPGFPDNYPNNAELQWFFVADSGVYLISIKTLHLEQNYDYLYMGTGSTRLQDKVVHTLTGTGVFELVILDSNMFWYFESDSSVTDSGFQIEVSLKGNAV